MDVLEPEAGLLSLLAGVWLVWLMPLEVELSGDETLEFELPAMLPAVF